MSQLFSVQIDEWVKQTKAKGDQVLRAVSLELLNRVVLKSPVGNPELWAANAHAVYSRQTYNLFAERLGAGQLTQRTINKKFPLLSGKGYTGGRFRANWTVTIGSPSETTTEKVDPSGNAAITAGAAVLKKAKLGTVVYLMNNLPYAQRLEEGWSKQAPVGMVRVTVAEFLGIVNEVVATVANDATVESEE